MVNNCVPEISVFVRQALNSFVGLAQRLWCRKVVGFGEFGSSVYRLRGARQQPSTALKYLLPKA